MHQLHSAIYSRYLAIEAWAEIFPPTITIIVEVSSITVVNFTTIHRSLLHKFVSKITVHMAIHTLTPTLCTLQYYHTKTLTIYLRSARTMTKRLYTTLLKRCWKLYWRMWTMTRTIMTPMNQSWRALMTNFRLGTG